jgi:hypothetical protein
MPFSGRPACVLLAVLAGCVLAGGLAACGAAPTPTVPIPTAVPPPPSAQPFTEVTLELPGCVIDGAAPADRVSAPAGDFIFLFMVARSSQQDAASAVGDSSAAILVGGQPASPLAGPGLGAGGRTQVAEQLPSGAWAYTTRALLNLPPGEYMLGGSWLLADGVLEARGCTLVVTAP